MSERSIKTETLSINATICMQTDNDAFVTAFLDDLTELLGEWQTKVQVTNLNVAVHDHRDFDYFTKKDLKTLREKEDTE